MNSILTYSVVPKLPAELEPMRQMVYNLWWTWEPDARALFRHLDIELWEKTNHSPLLMLQLCKQARLTEVSKDEQFLRELKALHGKFQAYMARRDTYWRLRKDSPLQQPVAYFSAEFGFHESFPNYSGGLGILSGDHCKSASDLDLNFLAVTLLYRDGYFRQEIDSEGWQHAVQLNQNFSNLPIREVQKDGKPLTVSVSLPGREVQVKLWELQIGRIKLYLLDTLLPENSEKDRAITAQLYGGDNELRIQQEIVLGIGGVRALAAMGINPQVFHMNEGHSAFLGLERIRTYMQRDGLDFTAALQVVAASNIFTTHTPVPAGNDAFSRDQMQRYFGGLPAELGITFEKFFSLGQETVKPEDSFSMTILALRTSRFSNGVAKLHGEVSRELWKGVWKDVPTNEVPIMSVTNGVHTKTWAAAEITDLYTRYLGPDWEDHLTDVDYWRRAIDIPDDVLWQTHQMLKQRLVDFVRDRVRRQAIRQGDTPENIRNANRLLNPEILTVGFARRFATYKRAALLFSDPERLARLVTNHERPVQFLFAGKAHPKDEPGKKLIQTVYKLAHDPRFQNRIVFIEDYDTNVGRRLYHGVDLWLNNPMRPLEASGTSGMKLPPNGGVNLSVLDGWWPEAYDGRNGWAIGPDITGGTEEFQTHVDTASLFNLLENQIVPLYYAKPDGRLPLAWIQLMRESMRTITPVFNTHRMVKEYTERLYEPAARASAELSRNGCKAATELSLWKDRIRKDWWQVRVADFKVSPGGSGRFYVGEDLEVTAYVQLGTIKPEFVRVQAYFGPTFNNEIQSPSIVDLPDCQPNQNGEYIFRGRIPAAESGSYGLNIRVLPTHPNLIQPHELRLITWAV